jgi:hypothetical protein
LVRPALAIAKVAGSTPGHRSQPAVERKLAEQDGVGNGCAGTSA